MELRLASHEVAIGLQGGFVLEDLSQYNPRAFHRNPNSSSLVQNFDEFCPSTVSPLIFIVMEPRRSWRPGRQWRSLEVFTKLGSRSQMTPMIDGTSSHNFHHGINGCKYAPIQVPIFWVMSRSPRLKEYTFASGRLKPRASRLHPPRRPVETLKIMLGKGRQSFGILWVHLSMYGAYLHTVVYFSVLICR